MREEGFVDVGSAVVADEQSFELVQPGEGALDDPAVAAEPGAVLGLASCDLRCDAALAELAAATRRSRSRDRRETRSGRRRGRPTLPRTGGTRSRSGISWVLSWRLPPVSVQASGIPRRVDEEVVLGAVSGSINRARARRGAPFFACTWLPSATARDHSISPAARNRASSNACSRSHTPAFCHSSIRRQQVTPEPKPSSSGRCVHEIPVCNTNKIPCSACRSGSRLRPG